MGQHLAPFNKADRHSSSSPSARSSSRRWGRAEGPGRGAPEPVAPRPFRAGKKEQKNMKTGFENPRLRDTWRRARRTCTLKRKIQMVPPALRAGAPARGPRPGPAQRPARKDSSRAASEAAPRARRRFHGVWYCSSKAEQRRTCASTPACRFRRDGSGKGERHLADGGPAQGDAEGHGGRSDALAPCRSTGTRPGSPGGAVRQRGDPAVQRLGLPDAIALTTNEAAEHPLHERVQTGLRASSLSVKKRRSRARSAPRWPSSPTLLAGSRRVGPRPREADVVDKPRTRRAATRGPVRQARAEPRARTVATGVSAANASSANCEKACISARDARVWQHLPAGPTARRTRRGGRPSSRCDAWWASGPRACATA